MDLTASRNRCTKNRIHFVALLTLMAAVCGTSGSSTFQRGPNLKRIYEARARYRGSERRPVIVIPGILGSRLEQADSGTVVWGAFDGDYAPRIRTVAASVLPRRARANSAFPVVPASGYS